MRHVRSKFRNTTFKVQLSEHGILSTTLLISGSFRKKTTTEIDLSCSIMIFLLR